MSKKKTQAQNGWRIAKLKDVALVGAGNSAPQGSKFFEDGRLQADGLVTVDNNTGEDKTRITLADFARSEAALEELPDDLKEDVAAIIDAYGDLDHNAFKTVYDKYPAYAKKSRVRGKGEKNDK